VGARPDHEDALALGRHDAAEGADVALECGLPEPRDLCRGEGRRGLAEELGGLAPAASERERDVVVLGAGDARNVGGRLGGDGEGVGGGVVEGIGL